MKHLHISDFSEVKINTHKSIYLKFIEVAFSQPIDNREYRFEIISKEKDEKGKYTGHRTSAYLILMPDTNAVQMTKIPFGTPNEFPVLINTDYFIRMISITGLPINATVLYEDGSPGQNVQSIL